MNNFFLSATFLDMLTCKGKIGESMSRVNRDQNVKIAAWKARNSLIQADTMKTFPRNERLCNVLRRPPRGKFAENHWIAIILLASALARFYRRGKVVISHQLSNLECSYKYKPGNDCYNYKLLYSFLLLYSI